MFHPLCCVGMNYKVMGTVDGDLKNVFDIHGEACVITGYDSMVEGLEEGNVHVVGRHLLSHFSLLKMLL